MPFYRSCLIDQATLLVEHTNDPANELPRIDAYVHSVGGWLQGNCHVLMHSVGRRYGKTRARDADQPPELPAEDERPGLLGRLRPRDADRARPADPEARPEGCGGRLQPRSHPLSALQLHPRARPRLRAAVQRLRRPRARLVRKARQERVARLRAGRFPRLLDRRRGARRHAAADRHRHLASEALRRPAFSLRARVLVPGAAGAATAEAADLCERDARDVQRAARAPVLRLPDRSVADPLGRSAGAAPDVRRPRRLGSRRLPARAPRPDLRTRAVLDEARADPRLRERPLPRRPSATRGWGRR